MSARGPLLHEFFDRHWRQWADRIAVDIPPGRGRSGRVLLTYADLARRSIAASAAVRSFIDRPDVIVVLLLPRTSPELFAFELGVLRAGGAYTAIDPSFPDGRLRDILEEADACVVVTDEEGATRIARLGMPRVRVILAGTDGDHSISDEPPTDAPIRLDDSALAYVIYTSGTTGRPKGVMIEHRAIANLVAGDLDEFRLMPGDRVGHGSSHAYDSSVEETWLALASGATLVVLDDAVVRAGPDLVSWLSAERISVLCPPPTLLRTMGSLDAAARLPGLKLLYVGGEPLTRDVADAWAPNRRLVNGYGPTECAVTVIRGDVHAGDAITIGRPIPGVEAWILDSSLDLVADGEPGELCLSGACLARGYRDDPALSSSKFPVHPRIGRIYRTGDLAHRDRDGRIVYRGRIDSQVKLRGYRIELEEIESHLARCPGVRAAASRVQDSGGRQELVAFLVAADRAAPPALDAVRSALAASLPAVMVPRRMRFLDALPTTAGGKLDRAALPLVGDEDGARSTVVAPANPIEATVERAVRLVLRRAHAVSVDDDFFIDLGGDSLGAAELATELGETPETASIAVRDIYEAPTIRLLAARAHRAADPPDGGDRHQRMSDHAEAARAGRMGIALTTTLQAAWLSGELVAAAAVSYLIVFHGVPLLIATWGLVPFLVLAPVVAVMGILSYAAATLLLAVAVKRLVIGRYVRQSAPVWSRFYLRHWIVQNMVRLVPWSLLSGTEMQVAGLRALGARIGRRVHIHRGVNLTLGGWDLLDIGDDVSLGQDAELRLVELDAGLIVVAPIRIGSGVTIETRGGVAGDTRLDDGAHLTSQSDLTAGSHVPEGERWDGIPARPAGRSPTRSEPAGSRVAWTPWQYGAAALASEIALGVLLLAPAALLALLLGIAQDVSGSDVVMWLASPGWSLEPIGWAAAVAFSAVPVTLAWQALIMRAIGRVRPGVISRWSPEYLRVWLKTGLLHAASDWLSGSLLWPVWLRMSGMTVGAGCEISTIIDVVPELVDIGASSFLADGIYLGGPDVSRGTVTLAPTSLGSGVFVGNHAIIPAGQRVADGVLIGVSTVAGDFTARTGTAWFGHPPFELARRPSSEDRRLTHDPSAIRYANRVCWEWLRFAIPLVALAILLAWATTLADAERRWSSLVFHGVALPAITLAAGATACLFVLALKWVLLGRVRPGQHPLWSCWCSRWDFLYVVWAQLARPALSTLEGTLLLPVYLRAMGARIGRRTVLGPGFAQVVDPDMLHVEDDVTLHALLQAHTFEDRILKIDRVVIRRRATVGSGTVLLYGADIGEGTLVAPHSVVMKRQRLTAGLSYAGCPVNKRSGGQEIKR